MIFPFVSTKRDPTTDVLVPKALGLLLCGLGGLFVV